MCPNDSIWRPRLKLLTSYTASLNHRLGILRRTARDHTIARVRAVFNFSRLMELYVPDLGPDS